MTDKEKCELVAKCYEKSKLWRESYESNWEDYYDLYRGKTPSKPKKWMHNIHVPLTLSKVNAMLANLIGILFSVNPFFDVRPREGADVNDARRYKQILIYRMEQSRAFWKLCKAIKQCLMYGTTWLKVFCDNKVDIVNRWAPKYEPIISFFGADIGKKRVGNESKEKVLVNRFPNFVVPDLWSIYPEPYIEHEQDGWIIHKTQRSIDYLIKMEKAGVYANVKDCFALGASDYQMEEKKGRNDSSGQGQSDQGIDTDGASENKKLSKVLDVYEWWGMADIDGDGVMNRAVITTANNQVLLRAQENPYWHNKNPFVRGTYIDVPDELMGIGLAEVCQALNYEINDVRNQRMDNVMFVLNKMFKYKKNSVDPKRIVSQPGGAIPYDENPSDIEEFSMTDVTGSAWREVLDLERWLQEATAVTKFTMGMTGSSGAEMNQTATGMKILQQMSGNQFVFTAKQLEDQLINNLLKMFYQIEYQYFDIELFKRILGADIGPDFIPKSPEEIEAEFDLCPAGVFSMENKNEKAQALIQFKSISQQDPTIKQEVINKRIAEYLGIERPEELVRTPEEMMQMAQIMGTQESIAKGAPPEAEDNVAIPDSPFKPQ